MKLFFYYAFHSVINQIRKLCKTWFIGLLIGCFAIGLIIGSVGFLVEDNLSSEEEIVEVLEEEEIIETIEFSHEEKMEIAELAATGIIVVMFALLLMNLEKTGLAIFQPADISILFASPMSPQSVVMFRSFCSMGMTIFMTIYFMIEIPALKDMLEIGTAGAASIILAFGYLVMTANFIKIYISILISNSAKVRKYWSYVLYILLGAVALAFVIYLKGSNQEILDAAIAFFNHDVSRFIPIIGWLKGIAFYGIEGNLPMFLLEVLLSSLTIAAVLVLIKHSKPDFYEEAIHKSEEVAELALQMKEKNSIFAKTKKSDKEIEKDEKVRKDGLNKGKGALMFFIKPMYNRFRFAKFGIFTKTLITYTLASIIIAVIAFVAKEELPMLVPVFVIAALVFYRTLGNPLREDVDSIYFMMAPEKGYKKLFWSLLAGGCNCLMDILPGLIIAAVVSRCDVLSLIGYLAFIVTMDMFSTLAGTFVHISLPQHAGATVKQTLQIMFIYFGILPDVIFIALTLSSGWNTAAVILLASLINIVLASIFFGLIIPYIDPRGGECRFEGKKDLDLKKAKSDFSRVGIAMTVFFAVTLVLQIVISVLYKLVGIELTYSSIWYYVLAMGPMYLVGLPIALLIMKKVPERKMERKKLSFSLVLKCLPVISLCIIVGSLVGNLISLLFSSLSGTIFSNPVSELLGEDSLLLQIAFIVLIGPFMEEFVFRKTLINKLSPYGERTAVLVSAILFGLFHGNFSQMFYACALGLVLGYIYIQTGDMKITFIFHALFNLINGVLPSLLVMNEDLNLIDGALVGEAKLPVAIIIYLVWLLLQILLAIVGFVILCGEMRNLKFKEAEKELPYTGRLRNSLFSVGMIVFAVFMIGYSVISYFI